MLELLISGNYMFREQLLEKQHETDSSIAIHSVKCTISLLLYSLNVILISIKITETRSTTCNKYNNFHACNKLCYKNETRKKRNFDETYGCECATEK